MGWMEVQVLVLIDVRIFFFSLIKAKHLLGASLCYIKPRPLASDATKHKLTEAELKRKPFFKKKKPKKLQASSPPQMESLLKSHLYRLVGVRVMA